MSRYSQFITPTILYRPLKDYYGFGFNPSFVTTKFVIQTHSRFSSRIMVGGGISPLTCATFSAILIPVQTIRGVENERVYGFRYHANIVDSNTTVVDTCLGQKF
jgi:hypothetical protein